MHTESSIPLPLTGGIVPLQKGVRSRMMGGWLTTFGHIGPDGGIVPTIDRDEQTMDAARELGHIDWSAYIKGGRWNDTHVEGCYVGLPETLEFHDGTTELSKAHGKVGFWTTGRLFDRRDPSSWQGLTGADGQPRDPTSHELDRADHFWRVADILKGTPRTLGLSAHGRMALSPCRKRILYCEIPEAAVCELPVNPDATLEPLALARRGGLLELRKGAIGTFEPTPCGRCSCPPGVCGRLPRHRPTEYQQALAGLLVSHHGFQPDEARRLAQGAHP